MIKVGILGAFDRYNYGDLLFPIIIEKWFSKMNSSCVFNYYGLKRSDLSKYGGKETKAINEAYTDKNDILIVAGGQTLNARWSTMHLNLTGTYGEYKKYDILYKILGAEISNYFARKKLKGPTYFPWIFPKIKEKSEKVIYNTVGGTSFARFTNREKAILKKSLNEADYISVRDPLTKNELEKMGVRNINLYPDSAILISEYFPRNELNGLINTEAKKLLSANKNGYLCFQIGKVYGRNHENIITDELIKIFKMTGLNIVLIPIGKALGHEDQIPLFRIKELIGEKANVAIVEEGGIYETMALISKSRMFIGTSLHGCITALSYGVPCVGLDKKVTKLEQFLRYFSFEEQLYSVPYENISDSIRKSLEIPEEKLQSTSIKLKKLANENFKKIYDKINT